MTKKTFITSSLFGLGFYLYVVVGVVGGGGAGVRGAGAGGGLRRPPTVLLGSVRVVELPALNKGYNKNRI